MDARPSRRQPAGLVPHGTSSAGAPPSNKSPGNVDSLPRLIGPPAYDTVRLKADTRFSKVSLDGVEVLERVQRSGGRLLRGRLGSLSVSVGETSTTVTGSLHTFAHGSNARPFTLGDFTAALQEVEEALGITLARASVWRCDIAGSLVVPRPTGEYVRAFTDVGWGVARRLRTAAYDKSITYSNKGRAVLLYDKGIEMGRRAPAEWSGLHVLRAEVQLKKAKAVARRLGEHVTAGDLCEPAFYDRVVDTWRSELAALPRPRTLRAVSDGGRPLTASGIWDRLAFEGVMRSGGEGGLALLLKESVSSGIIQRWTPYETMKRFRRVAGTPGWTEESQAARELLDAIGATPVSR